MNFKLRVYITNTQVREYILPRVYTALTKLESQLMTGPQNWYTSAILKVIINLYLFKVEVVLN